MDYYETKNSQFYFDTVDHTMITEKCLAHKSYHPL